MPAGTSSTFKVYEDQFQGAMVEVAMQFANAFNAASRGTILLGTEGHRGNFTQEAFWKEVTGIVQHRPTTDVTTDATPNILSQGEKVGVKVNKFSLVSMAEDAFYKIERNPSLMGRIYGTQHAVATQVDRLHRALVCLVAAISQGNVAGPTGYGVGSTVFAAAATNKMKHEYLNSGIALFGDRGGDLGFIVMHSKPWYDLVGSAITTNAFETQAFAIANGSTATLGRPVLVTDDLALVDDQATDRYRTLILGGGASITDASEPTRSLFDRITGKKNIIANQQTEWADTLKIKGYNFSTAAANPDDAALAVLASWSHYATDKKASAGVIVTTE